MYSDFVFLDRFLFELSCKKTHTHRDSNEYPIVAFSKNATITKCYLTKIEIIIIILTETVNSFRAPWIYGDILVTKKGYSQGISSDIFVSGITI